LFIQPTEFCAFFTLPRFHAAHFSSANLDLNTPATLLRQGGHRRF
jgi:hypothetical protein